MKPQSFEELVSRYGKPWENSNEFEQKHMTLWKAETLETKYTWNKIIPVRRIYCNRDLVPVLDSAFALLYDACILSELKTFDGCWNIRNIRGSSDRWSIHSFAMAIDFNAAENPLGGPVKFSAQFIAAFKQAGFTWGGDFKRVDGMHFQYADNC